jgi:hypothetical protein
MGIAMTALLLLFLTLVLWLDITSRLLNGHIKLLTKTSKENLLGHLGFHSFWLE